MHQLRCASDGCDEQAEILDRNMPPLPSTVIQKNFKKKGWEVGRSEKHDFCPKCIKARKDARRERNERTPAAFKRFNELDTIFKPAETPQPEGAPPMALIETAEAPAAMTRDDQRTIFSKLNEVYLDEKQGYASPWTDNVVAKDLGCPVAWVKKVREEFFGPANDNSEIKAILDEARKILGMINQAVIVATKFHAEGTAMVARANQINAAVQEARRSSERIETALGRIEKTLS